MSAEVAMVPLLLVVEVRFSTKQIKKNPLAGGLFKKWSTHEKKRGEHKRKFSLPVRGPFCKIKSDIVCKEQCG